MKCFAGVAIGILALSLVLNNTVLAEVKSGQKILICNGKYVAPTLIKDFIDDTWVFTNGHAKNCEVLSSTKA